VAERLDDGAYRVGAHVALGAVLFYQGKPEPALVYFRRGLEMFDPNMQFPDWPGSHPGVQCQFWPMLISWMLGYPDRSLQELIAAVESAETLGHPEATADQTAPCVEQRSVRPLNSHGDGFGKAISVILVAALGARYAALQRGTAACPEEAE